MCISLPIKNPLWKSKLDFQLRLSEKLCCFDYISTFLCEKTKNNFFKGTNVEKNLDLFAESIEVGLKLCFLRLMGHLQTAGMHKPVVGKMLVSTAIHRQTF